MDEMLRTEREIPKTVISEQEKPYAEALRANAIYDALIERRANWYQKYRPSLESVPEVTPKIASRYRRNTIRLVEAVKTPVEFLQDLEGKKYKTEESKKRTIARWKKKCDLATEVLQEKFAGEDVALSGGKVTVEEQKEELLLKKWQFGDLVKSLDKSKRELEETKGLFYEKQDQLEKALGESRREGKTIGEAIREYTGLGEEKDKIGDKLASLRKHLKEVEEEIGARTYWNFWGIVEQKIYEEKPEGMTEENWEKRKEVERRILEEFRKALPEIEKKDSEAATFMREKFQGREAAYQQMVEGEAARKEAAPTVVAEEAPEIAPEPRRAMGKDVGIEAPPAEPEKILLEDWKNWNIRDLAREARERRKKIQSLPTLEEQTAYCHQEVEPLNYELKRRTNDAFFWVDDALRYCYQAMDEIPANLYGMRQAITDARATLQRAKDLKAEISDAASLNFIEEQIDMVESKYKYVQAEFKRRKALYPEVKLPPIEAPEKPRIDLGQAWQELRERFRIKADLKLGERLKALGKPLSSEKAKALLEKQKAAAGERKEALEKIWERMRGISVLPSAGAVKDWADQMWAKVSIPRVKPLTKEDMKAALAAQKIEWRAPEFRRVKEWRESWQEMDPETRRKIAIRVGIGAAVGVVGGLVAYEIIGRHGREFQVIAQNFSDVTQAAREMLARAPTPTELPKPVTEVAEGAKRVLIEKAKAGTEIAKEVVTKPEVIKEAVKETVKVPWDVGSWRQMIEQAVAAKAQTVQTASEQVRQIVQTGVEIAKGSHSWGAAETAAKQVIEAAGVQSDSERLSILTDAINKAGGLSDLVQPGTKLMLKPGVTADTLTNTIEKVGQVIAHGGAEGLKVPADQEDLQALARVVEFLRGLK